MPRKTAKQHVNFRMPVELVWWIDQEAKANGVSRTEQILTMLEFSKMNLEWKK